MRSKKAKLIRKTVMEELYGDKLMDVEKKAVRKRVEFKSICRARKRYFQKTKSIALLVTNPIAG
jgi:hypothetical protein